MKDWSGLSVSIYCVYLCICVRVCVCPCIYEWVSFDGADTPWRQWPSNWLRGHLYPTAVRSYWHECHTISKRCERVVSVYCPVPGWGRWCCGSLLRSVVALGSCTNKHTQINICCASPGVNWQHFAYKCKVLGLELFFIQLNQSADFKYSPHILSPLGSCRYNIMV